jgi:type II secretory pathway component PulM
MKRSYLFLFVATGLALGGLIQAMKHISLQPSEDRLSRMARLEAMMDEGQPAFNSAPSSPLAHIRSFLKTGRIGRGPFSRTIKPVEKLETATGESSAADAKDTATAAATTTVAAADTKPKTDDLTKKADDKKKKKKKKTGDPFATAADANKEAAESKSSDTAAAVDSNAVTAESGAQPVAPVAAAASNPAAAVTPKSRSAQDWIAFLLANPTQANIHSLATSYLSGTTSNEVYYTVISTLLTNTNASVQASAVMDLGMTPSTQSFLMLASFHSEAQASQQAKAQATTYIANYSELQYLHDVAPAIANTGNTATALQALQVLQSAVQTQLSVVQQSTGGAATPTPTRSPAQNNLAQYFQPFIAELTQTAQTSTDPQVRSQARSVLSQVEALIGT